MGGEEAREVAKSFPLALSSTAVFRKFPPPPTGEVGAKVKLRATRTQVKDEWGQHRWPQQVFPYVVVNVRETDSS